MSVDPLFLVVVLACFVVLGILVLGIRNFGLSGDPKISNKYMRWRIIAQLIAVILIVGFFWMRSGG